MKHQIEYAMDKRVIRVRYIGDLTQEEAKITNTAVTEMIRDGIAPVHFIADATQLEALKINLMQMREAASFLREPQLGWLIIIGGNPIARFMGSLVIQLRKANFRFVDSLDEAFAVLSRVDTTLEQPTS